MTREGVCRVGNMASWPKKHHGIHQFVSIGLLSWDCWMSAGVVSTRGFNMKTSQKSAGQKASITFNSQPHEYLLPRKWRICWFVLTIWNLFNRTRDSRKCNPCRNFYGINYFAFWMRLNSGVPWWNAWSKKRKNWIWGLLFWEHLLFFVNMYGSTKKTGFVLQATKPLQRESGDGGEHFVTARIIPLKIICECYTHLFSSATIFWTFCCTETIYLIPHVRNRCLPISRVPVSLPPGLNEAPQLSLGIHKILLQVDWWLAPPRVPIFWVSWGHLWGEDPRSVPMSANASSMSVTSVKKCRSLTFKVSAWTAPKRCMRTDFLFSNWRPGSRQDLNCPEIYLQEIRWTLQVDSGRYVGLAIHSTLTTSATEMYITKHGIFTFIVLCLSFLALRQFLQGGGKYDERNAANPTHNC